MKTKHLRFIIGYLDGYPIFSKPTVNRKINKCNIIRDYRLDKQTKFKLEIKDKFIGW